MPKTTDDHAGSQEPEPDSESERADLEQALLAARVIVCKLMDEPPFRPPSLLQFETENRWLRSPLFTEGWVSDSHVCDLVSQLRSDVAWAFFMWESRASDARERWGSAADELRRLHDHVESWIRHAVIPAWKLHTLDQTPLPRHDGPGDVLMHPLRDEDVPRDEAQDIQESGSDYMRADDETGEAETGARRRVYSFEADNDHGGSYGPKGGWRGARPTRTFSKPSRERKKARPAYHTIENHLERAATAAGYRLEDFKAPLPRGHLSAEDQQRRDALASAVHELKQKGSRGTQIAKALSVNRSTEQRLRRRGAELAPAPRSRPQESHYFAGKKVQIVAGKAKCTISPDSN